MAKRKKGARKRRRSRSLSGLGNFQASRVTTNSVMDVVKPVAIGLAGAALGHFAGKGKNLIVAAVGTAAAIATGYTKEATPAIIGCAVVTPPAATATAGIDGIDGLKDFVSGGVNRGKGYAKSLLSNVGLTSVADKIAVSGFAGLEGEDPQTIYDQGYMAGVGDVAQLDEPDDMNVSGIGSAPYLLAANGAQPRSMAAAVAQSMGINVN